MTTENYFIDSDRDCHWYVIPVSRKQEWDTWLDIPDNDERSWEVPDFAQELGGHPSRVYFKEFQIL